MADHEHTFTHWPFTDVVNTAVFLCPHVGRDAFPVLRVCHDHDCEWQFLCGGDHSNSKPLLVCMGCAVDGDSTLMELADLPVGWSAERVEHGAPWHREPLPLEDGDLVDA